MIEKLLKFSPSLNLNKIEHFSKVSLSLPEMGVDTPEDAANAFECWD